jgi:hypothetical protein
VVLVDEYAGMPRAVKARRRQATRRRPSSEPTGRRPERTSPSRGPPRLRRNSDCDRLRVGTAPSIIFIARPPRPERSRHGRHPGDAYPGDPLQSVQSPGGGMARGGLMCPPTQVQKDQAIQLLADRAGHGWRQRHQNDLVPLFDDLHDAPAVLLAQVGHGQTGGMRRCVTQVGRAGRPGKSRSGWASHGQPLASLQTTDGLAPTSAR